MGIAIRLLTIGALPVTGFCIGSQAILGFGWGAPDFARVLKAAKLMLSMTVALSVAYSAAVVIFARPLVRLFSDSENVTKVAVSTCIVFHLFFWADRYSERRHNDASVVRESTSQCSVRLGEAGISLRNARTIPAHVGFQWTFGQSSKR